MRQLKNMTIVGSRILNDMNGIPTLEMEPVEKNNALLTQGHSKMNIANLIEYVKR